MKNWSAFLVCLLLSASIWLIHNLSAEQMDDITVYVLAKSSLPGKAEASNDVVGVNARIKASGFKLLQLSMKKDPVVVEFKPEDIVIEDGDFCSVSASQLQRYVSDIFGNGVSVESFFFDKLELRFLSEANKKVPIRVISSISCEPQYMVASRMALNPDSVLVYGREELLKGINYVETRLIEKSDVKSNLSGEVALVAPEGVRLSSKVTRWSQYVSRYVELKTSMPVHVRNAPEGSALFVNPSYVEVCFKCVFPIIDDPSAKTYYYVDYEDFSSSRGGHCVVKCDSLPTGVITATIDPEIVACVERIDTLQ